METFVQKIILIFFTAFGLLTGASLVGSLSAVLVREPPVSVMLKLAQEIKIWAIVAAIGGTFSTFEILESGILQGEIKSLIKQLLYILSSITGAQVGYYLIINLVGGKG
ncbi:YtrH family sporulation protein [Desulfolucanica intricata]|uniref:YtrH family sporulation protein n=1 Tax=Desulfolucanica intricata TaxID=1285191 RepID=UPI0008350837|nr:YtrH family sporulation protein [Desulfolucanica intricata]